MVHRERLIVTHGYHYDASRHAARWLSDTWSMSLRPPYKWQLLHSQSGLPEPAAAFIIACTNTKHCAPSGGVSNVAARQATSRKQVPAAPAGRYGMSLVVHMDNLWLFGGTDGGYHQSDDDGYQHGEALCSLMCSTETAGSL